MDPENSSLIERTTKPVTAETANTEPLNNKGEAKKVKTNVDPDPDKVMSVVEHLDELRTRMLRSIVYVAIGMVVSLLIGKKILKILEAPAGNITIQALSIEEPIIVFFKVAFYSGLILSSPFVLFEISRFISPGLTRKEREVVVPILILSPLLFCIGATFAYFCVLPSMIHFFGSFGQGISPVNQRLDFYVSLVSSVLLYMGLCFQLPLVIFALSYTGLVNSKLLLSVWRYAVFGAALIAMIITPDPTAFTMLLVTAALSTLYFGSVLLLKIFGR